MIRGILGIVPSDAMEVGRFYMAPGYRDGNCLFQCIQTTEAQDDGLGRKALFVAVGGKPDVRVYELPDQTPAVALRDVHVRVDPRSLDQSAFDTSPRRGLFLVRDSQAIVCAPTDTFRGWVAVNITTGRTIANQFGTSWLSFTRWSLVMDDDDGQELILASFDTSAAEQD